MAYLRQNAARLAATLVIVVLWRFARLPDASPGERAALGARFAFLRAVLQDLAGPVHRDVRSVHPSLANISAWISSVGAAVALNDIDGDGLPNDICHVDPRTDQVIVSPVPGTGLRYPPFALKADPLPFDAATMAPMGCLLGDLDENGRIDVLVYYWGRTPVLFHRREGQVGASAWVPNEVVFERQRWFTNAATLADLDGDGHVDIVVGNYFLDGSRILDASDLNPQSMGRSMSLAYNGGGPWLLRWKKRVAGPEPAVVFELSRGDFDADVRGGWILALGAADLDGDLLPELYLANDFGPDHLLHNQSMPGHLRFRRLEGRRGFGVPKSKVLGHDSFKGMGVDFGDINADGWPDIYVSNIASEFALEESHLLFASTGRTVVMRNGVAPYADRSEGLGLSRSGWCWDSKLADLDNDGVLEALQACGFVKGEVNRWPELHEVAMGNDELLSTPRNWHRFQPGDDLSGHDRNSFFVRGPGGRFVDVANELGLVEPAVSRGIGLADVDGDGRLDYAVANQWGESSFYRNVGTSGNAFLGLHLCLPLRAGGATIHHQGHPRFGTAARPAIGAVATVRFADGRSLVAQVDGGNGHSGKRSPYVHFGLGPAPADPITVDLSWRDPAGSVRKQVLTLAPGWHTVQLAWPED